MKIFGRELFKVKKLQEPNMYDFAQHGLLENHNQLMSFDAIQAYAEVPKKKKRVKKNVKPAPEITPKELFELKALNENEFKIASDKEYIETHVADLKDRLMLYKSERINHDGSQVIWTSGYESFGKKEIESMIERLNNRLRINEFKNIVDEFPHTTSKKISELVEAHNHLRCGNADMFVPDLPREATQAMKRYNEMCQKLSGKNTNFYIIAKRTDFERVPAKRDPILLAQSPFGFFWQILGAWDEEMEYLGEL